MKQRLHCCKVKDTSTDPYLQFHLLGKYSTVVAFTYTSLAHRRTTFLKCNCFSQMQPPPFDMLVGQLLNSIY